MAICGQQHRPQYYLIDVAEQGTENKPAVLPSDKEQAKRLS